PNDPNGYLSGYLFLPSDVAGLHGRHSPGVRSRGVHRVKHGVDASGSARHAPNSTIEHPRRLGRRSTGTVDHSHILLSRFGPAHTSDQSPDAPRGKMAHHLLAVDTHLVIVENDTSYPRRGCR